MRIIGLIAISLLLLAVGCTETTSIGTEILESDRAGVFSVDTFTIKTSTVVEDPLSVYSNEIFPNVFIGDFEDPVFGQTTSSLYTQFRINQNALPNYPDDAVFDSLVLMLRYDANDFYGDTLAQQALEVYEISEKNIPYDTTYYNGQTFEEEIMLLGSTQFVPNLQDSIDIKIGEDTVTFPPHVSIRLLDDLGTRLLDSAQVNYEDNDAFLSTFGGLVVKPVGGMTAGFPSYELFSVATGMYLFYHTADEPESQLYYEYDITTLSIRVPNMATNFSTAITDAIAGGVSAGEDLLYLGGAAGTNINIELPYLGNFKDQVVVNNAELSFTIQSQTDDDLYPLIEQAALFYYNADEELIAIDDVIFTFNGTSEARFGGQVETYTAADGTSQQRYQMSIPGHLQKMIDQEAGIPDNLILRVYLKTEKANRAILYGSKHPDYPVTLDVDFTRIN